MNTNGEYIRMKAQVAVLKEIGMDHGGMTIDSIIRQLETRVREMEEGEL
ncbi:MAG: hypothetical protein K2H16_10095 [Prevotella sp.]|nr:hypothetical protein [Prevotella sp.]MDE6152458.1 hypothetical protein [Prevotella sp.]